MTVVSIVVVDVVAIVEIVGSANILLHFVYYLALEDCGDYCFGNQED